MDVAPNPLDGCKIAYRVFGAADGPALVLVHGTALSQAIWRGFGWVRELQDRYKIVTLDLRGHGRSDKPHDGQSYVVPLFMGDVLAVLDAADIDRAHYVGYSLGGRVGFSLAVHHPERLASLVTYGGSPKTGTGVFDRTFFPGVLDALETGGMQAFIDGWEAQLGYSLDHSTSVAMLANDPLALASYMRMTELDPGVTEAELAAFTTPVFMVAGTDDPSRVRAAARVQSVLPATPVRLLDGASHGRTPRHPDALPALVRWLESRPYTLPNVPAATTAALL